MGEWKEYKLGDLVSSNNQSISKDYSYEEILYLDTGSITEGKIESLQNYNLSEAPSRAKRLVKNNDIIYSTVRPIQRHYGFLKSPPENLVVSTGFSVIESNIEIAEPKFVYYYLTSDDIVEILDVIADGSTSAYPSLKPSDIENLDVKLPPLPEQKAIASILSSLDNKIDLLHRQNKTLEQLAETLFRQWFVEEADESWEQKKLSDLLTITSSKRIYYSEYVPFGIPFYRSKEIIELHNTGATSGELFITEERFSEIKNKFGVPVEDDILMTSVGTLGVPYRVRKNDKFYFKDGNLTWFKDFKILPSSIIYLWLNSKIGQEQLSAITIGSTQEALTIEGLKSISLAIPPKEKIKIYEVEFNAIVNKTEFNQEQIRTLTQLRDTLLPKLMSGEVRVKL